MKAKYQHEGNDCLIHDQVVCESNIVVTVRSYYGSRCNLEPQIETKICLTDAEARRMFYSICTKFESQNYDCVY